MHQSHPTLAVVAAATLLTALGACDSDSGTSETTADAIDAIASDTAVAQDTEDAGFLASCSYENAFAGTPECREYAGDWTEAEAATDCEAVFLGQAGTFALGGCAIEEVVGTCTVGDPAADGYLTISGGDASVCESARLGCETFAGGVFADGPSCGSGALTCLERTPASAATFQPPYLDCRAPLAGEPAGDGPDGQVCTHTMISGSTEPGRYFPAYADCNVVRKQRPYYGDAPTYDASDDDPRLADADYMTELAWVKDQVRASACTCCHDGTEAPQGAAVWDIEAGPLWFDTVSDEALAMILGLTDSRYFGYYPAEDNNGFDRSATGLPTTDAARLQAFGDVELARRGLTRDEAAQLPPFAPFFTDLVEYTPEACDEGVGIDADGGLVWSGESARYVTILRAGSASPGVQPNWDLPEGTLWAVAADHTAPAMACGLAYGEVPEDAYQRFPEGGAAPEPLVSGETYYLHVQRDLAFPVTRCLFVAP